MMVHASFRINEIGLEICLLYRLITPLSQLFPPVANFSSSCWAVVCGGCQGFKVSFVRRQFNPCYIGGLESECCLWPFSTHCCFYLILGCLSAGLGYQSGRPVFELTDICWFWLWCSVRVLLMAAFCASSLHQTQSTTSTPWFPPLVTVVSPMWSLHHMQNSFKDESDSSSASELYTGGTIVSGQTPLHLPALLCLSSPLGPWYSQIHHLRAQARDKQHRW